MKENETLGQKKLESIDSEMFHSFDPDDASWISGGKVIYSYLATIGSNGEVDVAFDIQMN